MALDQPRLRDSYSNGQVFSSLQYTLLKKMHIARYLPLILDESAKCVAEHFPAFSEYSRILWNTGAIRAFFCSAKLENLQELWRIVSFQYQRSYRRMKIERSGIDFLPFKRRPPPHHYTRIFWKCNMIRNHFSNVHSRNISVIPVYDRLTA